MIGFGIGPLFRGTAIPGVRSRLLRTVTLGFRQFGLEIASVGIVDPRNSGLESSGLRWRLTTNASSMACSLKLRHVVLIILFSYCESDGHAQINCVLSESPFSLHLLETALHLLEMYFTSINWKHQKVCWQYQFIINIRLLYGIWYTCNCIEQDWLDSECCARFSWPNISKVIGNFFLMSHKTTTNHDLFIGQDM